MLSASLFFLSTPPPPRSPLFPYTTLFRSHVAPPAVDRVLLARLRARVVDVRAAPVGDGRVVFLDAREHLLVEDRKSTRLNSSHRTISYAVFCLKKKK